MPTPKRDAIMRAALEAFADHGVGGVAVPQIAALAGVGTGTIYRYFESKEALINVLFREQKAALAERLLAEYPVDAEPRERFSLFWGRLDAFAREQPAAFRFLELQDHLPYLTTESRAVEREVLATLAARVRDLQESGVFRRDIRAELLSAMIWGCFVQLHKTQRAGHARVSPEDFAAAGDAAWELCAAQDVPVTRAGRA